MPRLLLEAPVYVYCGARSRVAHLTASCAGAQLTLELRRSEVRRRLCKRCRRG